MLNEFLRLVTKFVQRMNSIKEKRRLVFHLLMTTLGDKLLEKI